MFRLFSVIIALLITISVSFITPWIGLPKGVALNGGEGVGAGADGTMDVYLRELMGLNVKQVNPNPIT